MTRRDEVFDAIVAHKARCGGDGPSYRVLRAELAARGAPLALATVRYHVRELVGDGRLVDPDAADGKLQVAGSLWFRDLAAVRAWLAAPVVQDVLRAMGTAL